jgi:HD-GYP domain-containing protein (c-di-GMP phosphodiesterase class II)
MFVSVYGTADPMAATERPRDLGYRKAVAVEAPQHERVRAAEVIGALCLATDLGMGFPFEHGLHSTLVACRVADRLGVDAATATQTYYTCLLSHSGCTTDAHVTAETFGDSLTTHLNPVIFGSQREVLGGLVRALPEPGRAVPVRAVQVVRRLPRMARRARPHFRAMCEVAAMLADGVGLPPSVQELLAYLTERWDGKGPLGRAKGEEIPLPMRIVHVAVDATFQRLLGGDEHAVRVVREHAGSGLDPDVAACLADGGADILALDAVASAWDEVLAREPEPRLTLEGEAVDRALAAMGSFADLISPYLAGHSAGVAELAATAASRCRLDTRGEDALRRAALVHDLGRVAIGARSWQKPGPLTADEWEQVRLHPYHTERVLSRSPFLAALAPVACAHHERLDGSGYHRRVGGADLALPARLLAAADAFHAMTEPRPYREPLAPEAAAAALADEARAGRLDADAVAAVLEASGQRAPRIERPAGLTEREAEVVGMLARGLQTKQVARVLGISVKTADRHVQNAYRKIGVSTRAAATLFAMEHGLVAWGELPMSRPPSRL